jgi:hypothetical protein
LHQGHPGKEHSVGEFSGVTIMNGFQGHKTEQKLQYDPRRSVPALPLTPAGFFMDEEDSLDEVVHLSFKDEGILLKRLFTCRSMDERNLMMRLLTCPSLMNESS